MTPTAIRDTVVGCNCSCSGCARGEEKEETDIGGRWTKERGKRGRKRDIVGGRVWERRREKERPVQWTGACIAPYSTVRPSVPRLGYFRDIGPERVASQTRMYIYIYICIYIYTYVYTWILRIYIYIYIDYAAVDDVCAFETRRRDHTHARARSCARATRTRRDDACTRAGLFRRVSSIYFERRLEFLAFERDWRVRSSPERKRAEKGRNRRKNACKHWAPAQWVRTTRWSAYEWPSVSTFRSASGATLAIKGVYDWSCVRPIGDWFSWNLVDITMTVRRTFVGRCESNFPWVSNFSTSALSAYAQPNLFAIRRR